jgi:hypothetical protein
LFHQNQTSKVKSRVIWLLEVRWWRFRKNNYRGDFQIVISPLYRLLFSSNSFGFRVEVCDLHIAVGCLHSLFQKNLKIANPNFYNFRGFVWGYMDTYSGAIFSKVHNFLSTFQIWYQFGVILSGHSSAFGHFFLFWYL